MRFNEKIALGYVDLVRLLRRAIIKGFALLLFKKTSAIKKILINRDGAFGDSIVALPAISIIRQNYPKAQIDLLSVNNNGVSFKDLGLDKKLINKLYNIKKQQRKETLKKLKDQNYDLFIQLPQNIGVYKSVRNMLLVRFYLNIKNAFGWDSGRIKSFMRVQKQYRPIPNETQRFINILKQNEIYGKTNYPLKNQTPTNREILSLLQSCKPIAFLIGGKLQAKKWPIHYWKSLAEMIGNKQKIIIIGGNDEFSEGEEIKSASSNILNLCGKLSIAELRYVLEKSSIAISLDTGAMHLCDTTNTKLIALFSTRDLSNKWFPNNKRSIVIEKVLHCSFCLKTTCADNICMSAILPSEVYAKIKTLESMSGQKTKLVS